ncbi:Hypothetical protein EIN_360970, partial [Entamoeba invadens IP1]
LEPNKYLLFTKRKIFIENFSDINSGLILNGIFFISCFLFNKNNYGILKLFKINYYTIYYKNN